MPVDANGRHEHDRDETDPDDRRPVDQLVPAAEVPRALLERAPGLQAEDDRQDERDVEADHRDLRSDGIADEGVRQRRDHQQERRDADCPDGIDRHAVGLGDAPPELVPRDSAVAREREHHPRRRRDRGDRAERLRHDHDEEHELGPARTHRFRPDQGDDALSGAEEIVVGEIGNRERHGDEQDEPEDHRHDDRHHHPPGRAESEARLVSSLMCADASKPVIVYWAMARPVMKT